MRNTIRQFRRKLALLTSSAARRHALVGPPHFWRMKRNFQIEFLRKVGLRPEHYILDIGCGTLRGGIPLIAYLEIGHYFGIEVRENVLEEGKKELDNAGLNNKKLTLIHTDDISLVQLNQKFDYIWAFSVLIHMSDHILNDCLALVSRTLQDRGSFYANVNIGVQADSSWQGFPLVTRSLEFYTEVATNNGLRIQDIGTLKELGHVSGVPVQDQQRMLKFEKVSTVSTLTGDSAWIEQ